MTRSSDLLQDQGKHRALRRGPLTWLCRSRGTGCPSMTGNPLREQLGAQAVGDAVDVVHADPHGPSASGPCSCSVLSHSEFWARVLGRRRFVSDGGERARWRDVN